MAICKYEYDGFKCPEETWQDLKYCILHTDLPDMDEILFLLRVLFPLLKSQFPEDDDFFEMYNNPEFVDALYEESEDDKNNAILLKEKDKKIDEKVKKGDFNFTGAKLLRGNFENINVKGELSFRDALIGQDFLFNGSTIREIEPSDFGKVDEYIDYIGNAGDVFFEDIRIEGNAYFNDVTIEGSAFFNKAKIDGNIEFNDSNVNKYVCFNEAKIGGKVCVNGTETKEPLKSGKPLHFWKTKFSNPHNQETLCRDLKKVYEDEGDRRTSDYYFYSEMDGKRRQKKHAIIRHLELLFIQIPFGYGVMPLRIVATYASMVVLFAFIFWLGQGLQNTTSPYDYLYFSALSAFKLGESGFKPDQGVFQILASLEVFAGTFIWLYLIAFFSRRFMR